MTDHLGERPESMTPDRLVEYVEDLRLIVQAEFDSLTAEGDPGLYEVRVGELNYAYEVARNRGIDVGGQ